MNKEIFLQRLKDSYPDADIRISKRGERLLVNGHVIRGLIIDDNMFVRSKNPEEAADTLASWVKDHFEKYGDTPGEYYGEDEYKHIFSRPKAKIKSCQKHSRIVEKYDGDLKQLVEDIGNLHYEVLADFMIELSDKLERDAKADGKRGRKKLSRTLYEASLGLVSVTDDIQTAWEISKPYMK